MPGESGRDKTLSLRSSAIRSIIDVPGFNGELCGVLLRVMFAIQGYIESGTGYAEWTLFDVDCRVSVNLRHVLGPDGTSCLSALAEKPVFEMDAALIAANPNARHEILRYTH